MFASRFKKTFTKHNKYRTHRRFDMNLKRETWERTSRLFSRHHRNSPLPPVHPLFKWNYVARPFCDTIDKIGESEVDVVRVRTTEI